MKKQSKASKAREAAAGRAYNKSPKHRMAQRKGMKKAMAKRGCK